MKTLKFKTSLKCNGCVNAIKPYLDKVEGIVSWNVDLKSPNKIVEVTTDTASEEEIQKAIEAAISEAGYSVELIN
ncbi:MAG: cation transporter [Bacteroidales bacterium]|jgi:copper chaperone